MNLEDVSLEGGSIHYYIPPPVDFRDILYYPVSTGYFECLPSYQVQRSCYTSYLLIVMQTGSLSYQALHACGVARAGQILLLDCNFPHTYSAQGKSTFTFIHFDGAQSNAICGELLRRCGNLFRVPDTEEMLAPIREIMQEMESRHRIDELQASSLIYGVLMKLMSAAGVAGGGTSGNVMVDRAIRYMQDHLGEKITVEMIAANSGYSSSYFTNVFTAETGMSPYQFLVRSRIERARQMLQTTELSIQDIAFKNGFNSVANFGYAFKKEVGVSPRGFRKRPL